MYVVNCDNKILPIFTLKKKGKQEIQFLFYNYNKNSKFKCSSFINLYCKYFNNTSQKHSILHVQKHYNIIMQLNTCQ